MDQSNDIDARMAALREDHVAMGARPEVEAETVDFAPASVPGRLVGVDPNTGKTTGLVEEKPAPKKPAAKKAAPKRK